MPEWIDITHAAQIMGYGDEPTDTAKGNVRVLLNHFKVEAKDEPKPEGQFGKARKLYRADQVRTVAGFKL